MKFAFIIFVTAGSQLTGTTRKHARHPKSDICTWISLNKD